MATVKVLRTVKNNLTSYNNFPYPLWTEEIGPVKVTCKDWDPNPECGNGLHGITKDVYKYTVYNQYGNDKIKWMVIEVDDNPDNFVKIDNEKVKFNEGFIIYQGNDVEKAIRMVFDDEQSLNDLLIYDRIYQVYFADKVKEMVKDNGDLIMYPLRSNLDFIDYELCKLAVNKNGMTIDYILHYKPELVDYDLCKLAVNKNGMTIGPISYYKPELVDYDLCKLAVNQSNLAIYYILDNKPKLFDYELAKLAVNRSGYALDYILKYKPELVTDGLVELHKKLWL